MPELSPLARELLALVEQSRYYSMREASMAAGLDPQTISRIVRAGKKTRPRPETLAALAEALDADYNRLLQLAGHPVPVETRAEPARLRVLVERINKLSEDNPHRASLVIEALLLLVDAEDAANAAEPITAPPEAGDVPRPPARVSSRARNRVRIPVAPGSGNADGEAGE